MNLFSLFKRKPQPKPQLLAYPSYDPPPASRLLTSECTPLEYVDAMIEQFTYDVAFWDKAQESVKDFDTARAIACANSNNAYANLRMFKQLRGQF